MKIIGNESRCQYNSLALLVQCVGNIALLFIMVVLLVSVIADKAYAQYRWQDDKGAWHFSDDLSKVPASVREKEEKRFWASYEKLEKSENIFQYIGFQPISPKTGVTINRHDFLAVANYLDQGILDPNKSYNQLSFPCLFLQENNTIVDFDLSALYFLLKMCKNISNDDRQKRDYLNWKESRKEGLAHLGLTDFDETSNVGKDMSKGTETVSQDWRIVFYLSTFRQ